MENRTEAGPRQSLNRLVEQEKRGFVRGKKALSISVTGDATEPKRIFLGEGEGRRGRSTST